MLNKKVLVSLLVIIAIIILLVAGFFIYQNLTPKWDVKPELTPDQIMNIAKTDKDYNEISGFLTNFDPQVVSYIKLDSNDYNKLKPEWKEQGLEDRINLVDKLPLTDSTYWIELKNKNDQTKGLRLVLDTKENKSLLLIVSMSISTGVGI